MPRSDPEYVKNWYARNRVDQQSKARVRMARARDLCMRLRRLVLSAQPCMDCDEPPDSLTPFEFDHRVGIGAKSQRRMSDLISRASSHLQFMKELKLCDVVCANCHKKRTYGRAGWSS